MITLTASQIVADDLSFILDEAEDELAALSGSRLLIAGGAGFLGHYLVQAPLAWNAAHPDEPPIAVTVLDSFVRGVPAWLLSHASNRNLLLRQHDITQPLPPEIAPHDYFIHAASIASPTFYRRCPIETMDANVNGLRHLLDRTADQNALGHPIRGLLFFSSSEIYGDPDPEHIPTPETYRGNVSCTGPRACYDESKRYGETLCVNFARQRGVPVKVARPFNNYGPGLKITDRRVLPDLARDIFASRDLVLHSDGTARRTFCYVADAIVGYFKILVRGTPGEAYNIGVDDPEISVRELAELTAIIARELLGYEGRVVHTPSADPDYLVDNPSRRCPDIQKARQQLGYNPLVALDEGIRRSLLWYAQNLNASEA